MQFERRDDIEKGARSWRRLTRTAAGASALLVLAGAGVSACGTGTGTGTGASGGGSTTTTAPTGGDTTTTAATTSSSTTTTAPPAPPLARGQQGAESAIPWSEVGQGWSVALWSSSVSARQDTVYVVDPGGGRYAAASIPAANYPSITDWSGDKQRVLISSETPGTAGGTTITDLDLATGATIGSLNLTNVGVLSDISFTRPDGLAIIVASYGPHGGAAHWVRYSPTGPVELNFPDTFAKVGAATDSALYTPDGDDIVIGAAKGLAVVENSGTVASQVPVPGASMGCEVMRWWQPGEALALCTAASGDQRFWSVPVSGAAPTEIVSPNGGAPLGLWQVDGDLYAQEGACGTLYITKLAADGTPTNVSVPGTLSSDSEVVIGANGSDLLVRATSSCDTAVKVAPSLLWFDVATNASTVILGTPLNGGDVESAFLYDAQGY
jgi:TolB protein